MTATTCSGRSGRAGSFSRSRLPCSEVRFPLEASHSGHPIACHGTISSRDRKRRAPTSSSAPRPWVATSAEGRPLWVPPLVASGMIGALGYYSRVPILDIFGLIDPVIARDRRPPPPGAVLQPGHHRSNPEYILERGPDFVLLPKQLPSHAHPATIDLLAHSEFQRRYVWDRSVLGYRRRDGTAAQRAETGH